MQVCLPLTYISIYLYIVGLSKHMGDYSNGHPCRRHIEQEQDAGLLYLFVKEQDTFTDKEQTLKLDQIQIQNKQHARPFSKTE